MSDKPHIDPNNLDPRVRAFYDMESYTLSMDLSRKRQETGLTFSQQALQEYCNGLQAFVSTRVMRHWNDTDEPPVKMTTLITVAINPDGPVVHEDHPTKDERHLDLAQRVLEVLKTLDSRNADDKALHAEACDRFQKEIDQARIPDLEIEIN